jgi:hypothetical protein
VDRTILFIDSQGRQEAAGQDIYRHELHVSKLLDNQLRSYKSLGTGDMPDKETVIHDLIDQMSMYPPEAVFFLNVWCFG